MSDRKFTYEFDETHVPPRCRKPRLRTVRGALEYDFRRATKEEAPVAIVQRTPSARTANMATDARSSTAGMAEACGRLPAFRGSCA